ncbi:MAG: FAD:protein FMN transferase [Candidatus Omnitrophica bacterium]|nr:FAD:protein FMN transferase [Candidatus Omnitrophota bacterium]
MTTINFKRVFIFSAICCLLNTVFFGCQKHPLYKETKILMGTFVEVISPYREAADIVFKEMRRVEDLLSRYKENSEVSRLNKDGKLKVSPETFYVIKKTKEFFYQSAGAFDITSAPLADLWGFSAKDFRIPQEEDIQKVLPLIGSDKIILHESEFVVEFKTPGTKIDLGAVGKGFALDCSVKKLKERRIQSCLINAGGQVYALGTRYGSPWKIGIVDPRKRGLRDILKLSNKSVSTSGDYEQYFLKDGKRYAHIFNPKTGRPADSKVVSVTVIADDGLTADALSTAIFVLGKRKGEELAKRFPNVEARIIEDKDVPHS